LTFTATTKALPGQYVLTVSATAGGSAGAQSAVVSLTVN